MEEQFKFASDTGFNVMRIFFTPVNVDQAMQTAPGEYVEETLMGFDYILDLGRRHGIKMIFVWVNNWQEWEGPSWVRPPTQRAAPTQSLLAAPASTLQLLHWQ